MIATVTDAETGEEYSRFETGGWIQKTGGQLTGNHWNKLPVRWAANDAEGNPLPEGAKVNVKIEVRDEAGNYDSVSFPVTIDNSRPYIAGDEPSDTAAPAKSSSAKLAVTVSGKKYLKFDAADDQYLAGAQIGTFIEAIELSTGQDTDFTALEDVHYNSLMLFNTVYPDSRNAYTQTFRPKEAGEVQTLSFDVTDYNTESYCISLCDYAGNKSFHELTPSETVPMSIHLDPQETTVVMDSVLKTIYFKVVDDDGTVLDSSGMKWTLTGNSGMFTSVVVASSGSLMITSKEESELLTLTVTDPADPDSTTTALIHIKYPGKPSVELDIHEKVMLAGDVYQFNAATVPEDTELTWTSSDRDVMEVSQYGEVTAMKAGNVTIMAESAEGESDSCDIRVLFTDVTDENKYYFNPVYWAAAEGITNGCRDDDGIYRTFRPQNGCTREAVVTFLWRLAGEPEPETTVNPFSDLNEHKYYYKAILWAAENGITKGYSDGTFRPEDTCLREHVVTFLYRYAGSPDIRIIKNPFNDIRAYDYYYRAAIWANANGIANGYSSGEHAGGFGPKLDCLREHVVTFLYRYARHLSE